MRRSNARGFSLLELVVSVAIVIVLTWLLFHVLAHMLVASRLQSSWDLQQSTIGRLVEDLTAEEDDAWAIYMPPRDVFGGANTDGHEVDFFARDARQRPYFWAYTYDAASQTVVRSRFASPGGVPRSDVTYSGITRFYAHTYPITALRDARTPIYSRLYSGAALRSGIVRFYASTMPWIQGGNNITYVHVEASTFKQDLQLATRTAPSGFTIVVYYTPSPSPAPTATPGALAVWPKALKLAPSGTTLAAGCTAIAYADAGMTQQLAAGTVNPYTRKVVVDSNGCYIDGGSNASLIWVHEAGYTGVFNDGSANCGMGVTFGSWYPVTAMGPTAAQIVGAGGTSTNGACDVSFQDASSTSADASIEVVAELPCANATVRIGGSCIFTIAWPNVKGDCDPQLGGSKGYLGDGTVTMSPSNLGTLTPHPDGSYTFTRTGSGIVGVIATETYVSLSAGKTPETYLCKYQKQTIQTLTIN